MDVDLNKIYTPFHYELVKKAANRQEFLNYLEPDDALQEAGLVWVLGVYAWVNSGRKAQGAGRKSERYANEQSQATGEK